MKFCGNCGNALDNSKKYCTKCGAINQFHSTDNTTNPPGNIPSVSPNNDLQKLKQDKERIDRELEEKLQQEKKRQQKLQQEQQRLIEEQRKKDQAEKERISHLQKEQDAIAQREQERLIAILEKEKAIAEEKEKFEIEKQRQFEQLKSEREKLHQELQEITMLKEQVVNAVSRDNEVPIKRSKSIWLWIFGLLFLLASAAAGYFLYTIYTGSNTMQLAQDAIRKKDWSASSGYLSKLLVEIESGKQPMSEKDRHTIKHWSDIVQQLSVIEPQLRQLLISNVSTSGYNDIASKLNQLNVKQLLGDPFPETDLSESVNNVLYLEDSLHLLYIQALLMQKDKLKIFENRLMYSAVGEEIQVDSILDLVANVSVVTIKSLYDTVTAKKLQMLNELVITKTSDLKLPVVPRKKIPVKDVSVIKERGTEEPAVPKTSKRDAD